MDSPVRILGIAGSLRKKSYNRAALAAAGQLFPPHTTIDIFVLDGIPGFNEDIEQNPPPIILEFSRSFWNSSAKSARPTPSCSLSSSHECGNRVCV